MGTFAGLMSHGFGGSNVYVLCWGQLNERYSEKPQLEEYVEEQIQFWPGGGGELDRELLPERSYQIAGTWNAWEKAQVMHPCDNNTFSFVITLGENRWEQFQIWLDGDPQKVLHPSYIKASKETPILGPSSEVEQLTWLLDGRGQPEEGLALSQEETSSGRQPPLRNPDLGWPGDRYRISLEISGKWRAMTWEKVQPTLTQGDQILPRFPYARGMYYIVGSWNDWQLEEMVADIMSPNVFSATFKCRRCICEEF